LAISSGRLTKIVSQADWGKSASHRLHVALDPATIPDGDETWDADRKKFGPGLAF
jgi:hypothetical protein